MSDAMKMSIDEVFNEAIMSSTPVILVEGIDDIKTYISIAKDALETFEVYPIETIAGYSAGCGHVIDAVKALYALNDANHPVENFVLGIIDRDTREYRSEMPAEAAILTLKYYSIESHFVCEEVLTAVLKQYARVHSDKLGVNFARQLFSIIEPRILEIYYFCLEALQCATVPGYSSEFKYSYAINRRKQEPTNTIVQSKRQQLDQFAQNLGLVCSLECLKKISAGKWLLSTFCESMFSVLENLSSYCGEFGSEECEYCKLTILEKCTYRMKEGINHKTLYSSATENCAISSLDYVRTRMAGISLSAVH